MVQNLYKNWLLVSKLIWKIWATSDKQWKVQKVDIWWATFVQKINLSKKYIPSAKTLYTEVYLKLLSTACGKIHQVSYVIFETIKSFFKTQLLFIFLDQVLHTLYKSSLSKRKFSDFLLLELKFAKFLMSFCKQKASFSSKFGSFFSVVREFFCIYFFNWNFISYWQK